ncbi:MAG TPA: hypothetical protein PLL93_08265, partial [bacterium]|nr:hypothetical protein [bacterium]
LTSDITFSVDFFISISIMEHTATRRFDRSRPAIRGNWSNRGQQRSRSDTRRGRSDRDSNRSDSSSLNTELLQTILDRLDRLENRSRSRDNESSSTRQQNNSNGRVRFSNDARDQSTRRRTTNTAASQPHDSRRDPVRSNNPHFRQLVQDSFRYAQLTHHLVNWQSCPRSISNYIDDLVSDIGLPLLSLPLRQSLQSSANHFKSNLVDIAIGHLESSLDELLARIRRLDQTDLLLARPLVERQLQQRLGRRLHVAATRRALDRIFVSAHSPAAESDEDRAAPIQQTSSSHSTIVPMDVLPPSNPPRSSPPTARLPTFADVVRLPSSSSVSPPSPRSPIEIRRIPSSATSHTVCQEVRRSSLPTTLHRSTSPPIPVPVDRPTSPSPLRRSDQPSTSSSTNNSTTQEFNSLRGAIKIHYPQHRRRWRLTSALGINTLVIADSNGCSWDNDDLPPDVHVDAFKGAFLHDVAEMLETAPQQIFAVDRIVIATGFNDRSTTHPDDVILEMQRISDFANHRRCRLGFVEIPILPTLSSRVQETLQHINSAAQDIFGADFIEIDQSRIQVNNLDPTGLHYDVDTAKYVLSMVTEHFLQ